MFAFGFLLTSSFILINGLPQTTPEIVCQGKVATSFGSDGRLFGFENGQSCVIRSPQNVEVRGPLTLPSFLTDLSSGITECKGNKVVQIGQDGRRWGWENERSCLIKTMRWLVVFMCLARIRTTSLKPSNDLVCRYRFSMLEYDNMITRHSPRTQGVKLIRRRHFEHNRFT